MKHFTLFGLAYIIAMFCASCTNIDELSDNNTIAEFQVISHSPNVIEIGTTEVEGDVIYIPIVYGQSKFPLRFFANLKITADIDQIVGIDFSKEQCLESIDDQIKFYVMAKSGLTRIYYIRARVVDPNDNNYLSATLSLKGVSPQTLVSERATISAQGDTLKMYTVGGSYPITIKPEFKIDEYATFRNFKNGETALKFDNERTTHKIKVISRNGSERLWNVNVVHAPLINGSDTSISDERRVTTTIDPREFSATIIDQPGYMVDEYFIDNIKNEIVLKIKEDTKARAANVSFPLDVDVRFKTYEGVELFDITNQAIITFPTGYSDIKTFYMLDVVDCVSRKWTIRLEEWIGSSADVLSFSYDYSAAEIITNRKYQAFPPKYIETYGKSIDLDKTNVEIYPDDAVITLKATAIRSEFNQWPYTSYPQMKWRFSLNNIKIDLSKGATCTLPPFEWITNTTWGILGSGFTDNSNWKTPKTFTVTAEDGTQKEWTLNIREPNDNTKSDKCNLDGFAVKSLRPNYAVLDVNTPTITDEENKTITIKLSDDTDCYPLSVYPAYSLSQYASITSQNHGTEPLVFESASVSQRVTITAQNGTSTSDWTIKLLAPVKAEDANVDKFTVISYTPSNFKINNIAIDKKNGGIKLHIDDTSPYPFNIESKFPLNIEFAMTVSDKATSEIGTRGTITFNTMRAGKSFNVTAQSGVSKLWVIKLEYRQALKDGDFDAWNVDSDKSLWGTANNSAVTGTTSEARNGGKVAVLTSGTTLGKFAAGSMFLGYFKFDITRGMSDPISLTYFGRPFQSTAKIKGIYVDLCYEAGSGEVDYGSAVVELVDYNNKAADRTYGSYQYHGQYPSGEGPRSSGFANNATGAVKGEYFIGNAAGETHRKTPISVVPRGVWQNDTFIPINYPNPGIIPQYTHLHIVFSSSGRGADFTGTNGSKLKVDNVRLVYED